MNQLFELCQDLPDFVSYLSGVRGEKGVTIATLADCYGYVENTMGKKLREPDWQEVSDIRRLAACLNCDDIQEATLISSYVCYWFANFFKEVA